MINDEILLKMVKNKEPPPIDVVYSIKIEVCNKYM